MKSSCLSIASSLLAVLAVSPVGVLLAYIAYSSVVEHPFRGGEFGLAAVAGCLLLLPLFLILQAWILNRLFLKSGEMSCGVLRALLIQVSVLALLGIVGYLISLNSSAIAMGAVYLILFPLASGWLLINIPGENSTAIKILGLLVWIVCSLPVVIFVLLYLALLLAGFNCPPGANECPV